MRAGGAASYTQPARSVPIDFWPAKSIRLALARAHPIHPAGRNDQHSRRPSKRTMGAERPDTKAVWSGCDLLCDHSGQIGIPARPGTRRAGPICVQICQAPLWLERPAEGLRRRRRKWLAQGESVAFEIRPSGGSVAKIKAPTQAMSRWRAPSKWRCRRRRRPRGC